MCNWITCCAAEMNTTLSINCTPIKFKRNVPKEFRYGGEKWPSGNIPLKIHQNNYCLPLRGKEKQDLNAFILYQPTEKKALHWKNRECSAHKSKSLKFKDINAIPRKAETCGAGRPRQLISTRSCPHHPSSASDRRALTYKRTHTGYVCLIGNAHLTYFSWLHDLL